jgi:SAM-dependent methyltransferase
MDRLTDPLLSDDRRAQLFEALDTDLTEKYAWAIPDERALRVLAAYAPIVEIGCGRGYWGQLLLDRGVSYTGFDIAAPSTAFAHVKSGGPEVLRKNSDAKKANALFLCYPDDFEKDDDSLALKCLQTFRGTYIVHVGESFGNTLLENPWGRSSASEFQEHLADAFHCILQLPLPSMPGAMDTISVWRRTQRCEIDDMNFRYIPASQRASLVRTSPDTAHLAAE